MKKSPLFLFVFFFFVPFFSEAKDFLVKTPTSQEVIQAIMDASAKTNVRPAMLYALYGQETGYGSNVGKTERQWSASCASKDTRDCRNWKRYDCKISPTNINPKFYDDILRLLGYVDHTGNADRSNIPTSSTCALGFTQVEPHTWWLVSSPRTGHTYNPWNIHDAILMAAFYLKDQGADGEEILGSGEVIGTKDRLALQRYYCGSKYQGLACQEYAASVEIRTRHALETLLQTGYKKQLEKLEEERKRLQKDLSVAVPLGCKEVPIEDFGFGVKSDPQAIKTIAPLLDKATQDLIKTYRIYRATEDKNLLGEIQQFAEVRKKYLVESLYLDPAKTLFSILLTDDREGLLRVTPQCVEEEITLEGMMDVIHIDFEEGSSQTQYTLITDDGGYVILHPAGGLHVPLESGMRVRIKGVRIDKEILFDGTRSLLEPHDASGGIDVIKEVGNPPVKGEQKVLVVMVNFQNTPEPSLTKETVRNVVFGEVDRYYREISYNKIFLTGDVFGWYTVPLKQSCDHTPAVLEAVRAVDSSVDFRNYGRLLVVAPLGPSCPWGGISTTGKTKLPTNEGRVSISYAAIRSGSANLSTIAHEMGHQFGNHHADSLLCKDATIADSGCKYTEYGDPYDIMGNRGKKHIGHMNALHKEYLGWLDDKTLKQITESGTYTLEPIEMIGDGLKAIKIQRKVNDFLYVEYRQPIGYDDEIGKSSNVFEGALLHVRKPDGDARRSALIDPTPPGDIFTTALLPGMIFQDPVSGATVSTVSRTPRLLTLRVTAGKKDFTPPRVSITYPSGQPTVSGIINVSASATHSAGIERVDFYYVRRGEHVFFGSDHSFPYETELDTQKLEQGLNYVFVKAYDPSGNERVSILAGFYVTVPDREPPEVILTSPQEGEVLRNPVTFRATATDDSGISFVVFKLDSDLPEKQTFFDYKTPFNVSHELSKGFHTMYAEAQDVSGKISRTPTVSFEIVEKDQVQQYPDAMNREKPVSEVKKKIVEKKIQATLPKSVARLSEGRVGVLYTTTLTAAEGTPPYTWEIPLGPGGFPSGLSLVRETGVISGTPKESGVWLFYANFYGTNGEKGVKEFGIEIKPALSLVIDTNLPSGIAGNPYKAVLSAKGINPPYTWSSPSGYGQFPPGLSLSSSGIISGTPSKAGAWIFSIKITDANGQDIIEEFGIEIVSPLEIKTGDFPAGLVGSHYRATLEASGAISPPYHWGVISGKFPPGLQLNPNEGYISGTPNEAGSWVFTAKVESTEGIYAIKELQIDIRTPLLISDPLPQGTTNVSYSATPLVIGGIAPYTWSIESGTLPNGFSFDATSGKISGTPQGKGNWNFLLKVVDKTGFAGSRWMTLNIVAPLEILTQILSVGTVGSYYSTSTEARGGEYPYAWSISSGALPQGLTFSQYGYFSGTPGEEGNFPIALKVTDGSKQNVTKDVNLQIRPPLIIATSTLPNGTQGLTYTASLLVQGGSAPYVWSVSSGILPLGLSLDTLAGTISGTPQEPGGKNFSIEIKDAAGVKKSWWFWIDIRAPLTITTTSFLNGGVNNFYGTSARVSGGEYPYAWSLMGTLPPGLTFATSSGYVSGSPSSEGVQNFTLEVRDKGGLMVTKDFSIEIKPQLKITLPRYSSSGIIGMPYATSSVAIGGTPPYVWRVSWQTLPPGITIDSTSGVISGTPSEAGKWESNIEVKDSHGVRTTYYMVITITSALSGRTPRLQEFFSADIMDSFTAVLNSLSHVIHDAW